MRNAVVDQLKAWRDRMLTSQRFQAWSARSWWARPIASSRARRVFDLASGFVYTQTLLAALRLDLFEHLARRPLSAAEVAERTGLTPDSAERLLRACWALDLVDRRSGSRYGLGILGAPCVGRPELLAIAEHNVAMYRDLEDPVALLRGERPAAGAVEGLWRYVGKAPGESLDAPSVAGYSAFAAASATLLLADILAAYPLARHHRLLDVGGGEGAFLRAVAAQAPALDLMLFDLPAVADRARLRFESAGLGGRARTFGGDFRTDALPAGADLISLVRILHDHDDDDVAHLLRAAHDALEPGGTLLVAEPMAAGIGVEPVADVYFAFFFLAFGQGRARKPAEIASFMQDAGFVRPRTLHPKIPMQTALVVARRP